MCRRPSSEGMFYKSRQKLEERNTTTDVPVIHNLVYVRKVTNDAIQRLQVSTDTFVKMLDVKKTNRRTGITTKEP